MKFIQSLLLLLCCQFSFSDSGLTPIVKVNKQSSSAQIMDFANYLNINSKIASVF